MFDEADDAAQVSRMVLPSKPARRADAGLGLEPASEDVGQGVEVQGDEQIAQDGVGGGRIKAGAFLGQKPRTLRWSWDRRVPKRWISARSTLPANRPKATTARVGASG